MPLEHDESAPQKLEAKVPVLDYAAKPSSKPEARIGPFLQPLLVEIVLLILSAIIHDGGMMLRIVAVSFFVYWLFACVWKWWHGHKPSWEDRLCLAAGISIAAIVAWAV